MIGDKTNRVYQQFLKSRFAQTSNFITGVRTEPFFACSPLALVSKSPGFRPSLFHYGFHGLLQLEWVRISFGHNPFWKTMRRKQNHQPVVSAHLLYAQAQVFSARVDEAGLQMPALHK